MSDVDISAFPDLDFATITGPRVVLEAVLRRLSTPRGGLFYAPDYGADIRDALLARLGPNSLYEWKAAIEQEALQDDRVDAADASLSYDSSTESLTVKITLGLGPLGTVQGYIVVGSSGVVSSGAGEAPPPSGGDTGGSAAPAVTSPTNGGTISGSRITISGTGVPGAAISIALVDGAGTPYAENTAIGTSTVPAGGSWSLISTTAPAHGSCTATVYQTEPGKPKSVGVVRSFTYTA